jgi:dihydroneopterin aldolase
MPTTLEIKNIECYSYHGCLDHEAQIGAQFFVDVTIEADLTRAIHSDLLSATIDYAEVAQIVKEQMNLPSKLIEHAAGRIHQSLKQKFPQSGRITVRVIKPKPPAKGTVMDVTAVVSD